MKRIINKQTGLFLRDDFTFNEEIEIGLEVEPAQGFFHPKWDFDNENWIEGLSEIELESIQNQVPEKISKLQLKIQLVLQGFDLSTIENAIAQLPEPQRTIASLSWTEATNFYRNNSMIAIIANLLSLTSAQVDEIFINASKL